MPSSSSLSLPSSSSLSSAKIFLFIGILAAFTNSVLSINCYVCESNANSKCGEDFDEKGVQTVDCSKEAPPRFMESLLGEKIRATGCAKIISETAGLTSIIRSCYFGDLNHTSRGCTPNPVEFGLIYKSCEVCSQDKCNGSTAVGPIAVVLLITLLIGTLLTK